MPNNFQSVASGSGLLKKDYDSEDENNPIADALSRRLGRLKVKTLVKDAEETATRPGG